MSFYYLICRLRSRPRAVSRLTPVVCVCGFKGVHGVGASPGLLLCVPCTTVDVSLRVFSAARTASSRAANVSTGDRTMSSTAERLVPSTTDGETARWPRQRRDVEEADQHATGKSGKSQIFPKYWISIIWRLAVRCDAAAVSRQRDSEPGETSSGNCNFEPGESNYRTRGIKNLTGGTRGTRTKSKG